MSSGLVNSDSAVDAKDALGVLSEDVVPVAGREKLVVDLADDCAVGSRSVCARFEIS